MRVNNSTKNKFKELVITRVFDAPRELVWKTWTEPERVKQWWGPRMFTAPVVKIDFRVGGEYLYCMRSPDGKDYWSKGIFREIVPQERLVLTDSFADENGNLVPASYYGLSLDFPLESLVTVIFEEYPVNKTKFTLRYLGVPEDNFQDAQAGWNQSFDKLAKYLSQIDHTKIIAEPGKQEIFIIRLLDAPRELVYRAFTEAELYSQWIGPRRLKMDLELFEPRAGGRWRFVHEDKDGKKYGFHGVFHEVSPGLIIDTFEYEGLPEKGHVSLETLRLEEIPIDKTMVNVHSVYQSVRDRDGMLQSGMEDGIRESYERLEELLEKLKKQGRKEKEFNYVES